MGTTHEFLGLTSKSKELIAKNFFKAHMTLSFDEMIDIIDQLYASESFEGKTIGPFILDKYKQYKKLLTPTQIENWLMQVEGWCEIDTLCQTRFEAVELLKDFKLWKSALKDFSQSDNINLRRASLVLLCKPLRTGTDARICDLAFTSIETLKHEKNILITKAISWVLRVMTKNYRTEVIVYLDNHHKSLPAIAVRETRKKLLTGTK